MDQHRDGQLITVCDRCFRPKRLGEAGWSREMKPGAMAAIPESNTVGAPSISVRQADYAVDVCPTCLGDRQPSLSLTIEQHPNGGPPAT